MRVDSLGNVNVSKRGPKITDYVGPVGVFRLTDRGLELQRVMPGVDVSKDTLDYATARITLPATGEVPVVDSAIVTGQGFRLRMG